MKRPALIALLMLSAVIITPLALAYAGYESMLEGINPSRGMVLYFAALAVLLAMPFLNRYLKIIGIYFIAFAVSRGLMRITGEQDVLRAFNSILTGLELGIKVALPLLLIALGWWALISLLKKIRAIPKGEASDILERINSGRRGGKTLEQIRGELLEEGVSDGEISAALRTKKEGKL